MFNLDVAGKTYRVTFTHDPIGTVCEIWECSGDSQTTVGSGSSFRNPHDTPCKSVGRKLSLERALFNTFNDKKVRELFWNKYFEKTKKG